MKKDVLINIASSQTVDGNEDKMELSVTGTLTHTDNGYELEYTEYNGEMQGCVTSVSVTGGNCVSILRNGGYSSEMMLENEKRHNCLYSTPYGEITIGIYTTKIESDMTEVGGTLEMAYTIDFSMSQITENTMKITVSERNL